MHYWLINDSNLRRVAIAAERERGDAMIRAVYLGVVAIDAAKVAVVEAVTSGVPRLYRSIQRTLERRRAVADLQRLNDRLLSDIGIHRSEISAVVDETLDGAPRSLAEVRHLPRPGRSPTAAPERYREAA